MSVPHGVDAAGHYHPLLVDTTGRPLIVIDTLTGLTFTVTPDAAAEWTVKPKAGETWTPLQTTPGNLTVGDHGYDGAAWRKQGLTFAYKSALNDTVTKVATGAAETLELTGPAAGTIQVITSVAWVNATRALTINYLQMNLGIVRLYQTTAGANNYNHWDGLLYVPVGSTVSVVMNSCTVGDNLYAFFHGYVMGIAM